MLEFKKGFQSSVFLLALGELGAGLLKLGAWHHLLVYEGGKSGVVKISIHVAPHNRRPNNSVNQFQSFFCHRRPFQTRIMFVCDTPNCAATLRLLTLPRKAAMAALSFWLNDFRRGRMGITGRCLHVSP